MNLRDYKLHKQKLLENAPRYRRLCTQCFQRDQKCYCELVKPFDPGIKFVILIHPIEVKRKIASGRMTYLSLINSEIIKGENYTYNNRVNEILDNPQNQCMILYPGRNSFNITNRADECGIKPDKKTVLFVIDGTWATARKTMRLSQNLRSLPQICFTPPGPSNFRVRKQPRPECLSTIEAVHHSIELLGESVGFDVKSRKHDQLLTLFDQFVDRQISYVSSSARPRYPNRISLL